LEAVVWLTLPIGIQGSRSLIWWQRSAFQRDPPFTEVHLLSTYCVPVTRLKKKKR
uniref:Uncharacterized protein n=1 Tax=Equus asinus TaxID=9793 RepID=A0A8C4MQ74_EQUAS